MDKRLDMHPKLGDKVPPPTVPTDRLGCVVTYLGGQVVTVQDRTGERRSWWPDELKAA
jgi:hypothetical protein